MERIGRGFKKLECAVGFLSGFLGHFDFTNKNRYEFRMIKIDFQKVVVVFTLIALPFVVHSGNATSKSPMEQFVDLTGVPVTKSCSALILGAYQTNLQAEEVANSAEAEMGKKDPAFGKALVAMGNAKFFLFNNEKTHADLIRVISKVPVQDLQSQAQSLTPGLVSALKKHQNQFFSKCETKYLELFMKCKSKNTEPRGVLSCFNNEQQQSAEIRKLYDSI